VNAPNFISLMRLLSVPLIVWLALSEFWLAAFWVFVAAGLSDALDGAIAKRTGQITVTGRYLDPIADKTLLVAIYITLGQAGYLPVWLVLLVVSRDLLIVGGALLGHTLSLGVKIQPVIVSKINTGGQIVLAALAMGQLVSPSLQSLTGGWVTQGLIYFVGLTTAASGITYVVLWGRCTVGTEEIR
jgi:cardiolipin synthase